MGCDCIQGAFSSGGGGGGATVKATVDSITADVTSDSSTFADTGLSITCAEASGIFQASGQLCFKMSQDQKIGDFRFVEGTTNLTGVQVTSSQAGVEMEAILLHCGDADEQAIKIQIASNDDSTDMTLFGSSTAKRSLMCLIEVK